MCIRDRLRDAERDFRRELSRQRSLWHLDHTVNQVTAEDVAAVVAGWTGIPVTTLTQAESERLLHLEEELHRRVVGPVSYTHLGVGSPPRALIRSS